MGKLIVKLQSKEPGLVVSLVQNSLEAALAAQEAGADGLKLHVNLNHTQSGGKTGTLAEEKERLQAILERVSIPVGLSSPHTLLRQQIEEVKSLGFDFVDFYASDLPVSSLNIPGIDKWVAIQPQFTPGMIQAVAKLSNVSVIEIGFLLSGNYRAPLTVEDLARIHVVTQVARAEGKPTLLPTDRFLSLEDVAPLFEVGVKNIMIGVAVTGLEPSSIGQVTKTFRQTMDTTMV
ncbi:MAG: hypothetical protein KJ706_02565 [Candidatus Omnitrophica bacterium]|nr:hypothetical protein [Candidatus Omnitrophota bacterium]